MRLIGLLLTLVLIGVFFKHLDGGRFQPGPTGIPPITDPIHQAEETVERVNQLEQERVKQTMGE